MFKPVLGMFVLIGKVIGSKVPVYELEIERDLLILSY